MIRFNISRANRRRRVFAILPALLLTASITACGDQAQPLEPPIDVQLTEARAAADRERSLRIAAEDRFGTLLLASVIGIGVSLGLGFAAGSSRHRPALTDDDARPFSDIDPSEEEAPSKP